MRTEKSCGPDTPTLVSSSWDNNSTDNGGKKARSPGRARRKPLKPFCSGMPGCSGGPVVTNARVYYTTRAAARASAPGIPHALNAQKVYAPVGRAPPRDHDVVSVIESTSGI